MTLSTTLVASLASACAPDILYPVTAGSGGGSATSMAGGGTAGPGGGGATSSAGEGTAGVAATGLCGSVAPAQPSVTLVSINEWPVPLAADGTYVYWSESDGVLRKVPKAGGTATVLASAGSARSIAVQGGYVYWHDNGGIQRVPTQGGAVEGLVTEPMIYGFALDAENLYWSSTGGIQRRSLAPSSPTIMLANASFQSYTVAVDAINIYLESGGLQSEPLTGGPVTLLAPPKGAIHSIVAVGGKVFWGGNGLDVIPAGGGAVTSVPSGAGYFVAHDATHVYWTAGFPGTMMTDFLCKIPIGGGEVTTLASDLPPGGLSPFAVDDTNVYWSQVSSTGTSIQSIQMVPK
jgi:hypothetical protein